MTTRRKLGAFVAAGAMLAGLIAFDSGRAFDWVSSTVSTVAATGGYTPTPAADSSPSSASLDALFGSVNVVAKLPNVPGYDRECGKGDGCVFGASWTDKYVGAMARNGCDTRNDVLKANLSNPVFKPGTGDCKVVGGTLFDSYTGKQINFSTANPSGIQIDHVFALSRAWDAGASTWTVEQRVNFANDTEVNLIAVEGKTNQSKSDQGLDTWLPPNSAYHCEYSKRYLTVAAKYGLSVTTGDLNAARKACA